jgi:phage shock protein PspC (stress-responsive transcriptional regulator)
MNKTIHINLAGHAFSIDVDAFERLDTYLEAVKAKLGYSDEAKETLDDINLRIAELFRGVHHDASSAITLTDVEEVIKTLGDPADYEEPEDPDEPGQEKSWVEPPMKKQLFRDPDNRFLGGVCSGLGNYFNLDPIVFRLLFILAALFYGSSLLVYIILWIAIPKASTVQQRIMMMGGATGSDSWRRRQMSRGGSRDVMNGMIRVIAVVAGIFLILLSFLSIMGVIMTFSLTDLLFGTLISNGAWIPEFTSLFLMPGQRLIGFTGLSLTLGIPLVVLFYLGMHLVFRFKRGGTAFLIVSLILWLTGIGMITYTAVSVAGGFANKIDVKEQTDLEVPASDTIYIEANKASMQLGEGQHLFSNNGMSVKKRDNELLLVGTPDIKVVKSPEPFKITVQKKSRGPNTDKALENANMIEFFYLQNDSLLMLDRYFSVQNIGMMRSQKVNVTIEVPDDKEIKIGDALKYLIDINPIDR